jgi:hypothetical protein
MVKYALGLTPGVSLTGGGMTVGLETSGGANYLTLTANRFMAPPDVTVSLEASGDLATWSAGSVISNTSTVFKARDTIPAGSAPKRFIRLRVVRP